MIALHNGMQKGIQQAFFKETKDLVSEIEKIGNPLMEDSDQFSTLDTKEVADQAVVNMVTTIETLSMEQNVGFTNERLNNRNHPYANLSRKTNWHCLALLHQK